MPYAWTEDDADALIAFAAAMGIDAAIPLHCWANESNNDPAAHNPNGNASGLFQLMPDTARGLGYPLTDDPDLSAYRRLSAAQQIAWATRYYAPHKAVLGTVAGFYCVTFMPARAGDAWNASAVVCGIRPGDPYAWAYRDNESFDRAGKGCITMQDLTDAANRAYGPRAEAIAAMVASRVDTVREIVAPSDLGPTTAVTLPDEATTVPDGKGLPRQP